MEERDGNPEATIDVKVIKDSLHAPIVFILKQVISILNPYPYKIQFSFC